MWARVVEVMLACWLGLSPIFFGYPQEEMFWWYSSWICSFSVLTFALLSFNAHLEKMHLLTLLVSFWLIWQAYASYPEIASAPQQNGFVIGMILLLTALVPSQSHLSPKAWEEFFEKQKKCRK